MNASTLPTISRRARRHVVALVAVAALAGVLALMPTDARAQTVHLTWDRSPTPGVAGYVVEWGTAPGDHRGSAAVDGQVTGFETPPLRVGLRYYFVVRAVDGQGLRSDPSNEVPVVVAAGRTEVGASAAAPDAWPSATLAVHVAGNGSVAGVPASPECSADCQYDLPLGTRMVLAASPAPGHRFVRWMAEGCDTAVTCTVGMAAARVVGAEFAADASSTPVALHRRYLAEGAASDFFDTRIVLANPGGHPATATVDFQRGDGVVVPVPARVPPLSAVAIDAASVDRLTPSSFSTVVASDRPLVVDRTMTWHAGGSMPHGSHAETSVAAPASRWYLAEGSTRGGFDLFYLLQNPGTTPVTAHVRFLRPDATPLDKWYLLPPTSRMSIWVDHEMFGPGDDPLLAQSDVSAVIDAPDGSGIVVERAMYDSRRGMTFTAGHESAGLTQAATRWYLAEGATGDFFDLFLLLANPNSRDATVVVSYLLPDGTRIDRPHVVRASQRYTIWVDKETAELADTAVSMVVHSTNGVPVVVERSMWWPGNSTTWSEAHNSPGVTEPGRAWAVADGESQGPLQTSTYLLVVNPDQAPARVRVTLMFRDGAPAVSREFAVGGSTRFGIDVGEAFPEARGERFGALIESLGDDGPPVVVERAMYADSDDQPWASGSNVVATRLR